MASTERHTAASPQGGTVTHVETRSGGGSSALWLIIGAVIAGLAIFYFVGFTPEASPSDDAARAVEGAASAVEGAAQAVEGAAEGAAPASE